MLVFGAITACQRTPSARERALARVPGAAQLVGAADGTALGDPNVRRALDAVRPRVADSFGCVLDAALAARAVAVAATRTTGAVVVIVADQPPRCPALSHLEGDLWVATIGDATVAPAREASVLAVSRWARARDYLVDSPLALAVDFGGAHVVAAAQVEPFSAWLALDASPAVAAYAEARVTAKLADWSTQHVAASDKLRARREAGQLVVRAERLDGDELAKLAPAVLDAIDPPPRARKAPALDCPSIGVVRCAGPTLFEVANVPAALAEMVGVPTTPIATTGAVGGLRLDADAALLLRRGDLVLGIDGVPVRSRADLADAVRDRTRTRAAVAIRRDGVDLVVVLTGRNE